MNSRTLLTLAVLFGLNFATSSNSHAQPDAAPAQAAIQPAPDGKPHIFAVAGGQFTLDGKPFRVISGEMHYPRIPRDYWRAR